MLEEWQIFRIDHFLGKEPAMDIMFLRFANSIFEPLWNRDRIQCVQITMAENFGVEDRGSFYDPVGALRDVVQNHLLQLHRVVRRRAAERRRRRRAARQARRGVPGDPADRPRSTTCAASTTDTCRCQGVQPDSQTETFAALRLEIDNWRWSGVPFFIRAGKALPVRVTEIRVIFKPPAQAGVLPSTPPIPTNSSLRIDPNPGPTWSSRLKEPGANIARRSTSR